MTDIDALMDRLVEVAEETAEYDNMPQYCDVSNWPQVIAAILIELELHKLNSTD